MALSLEAQQRIQILRAKVANNTITKEELREGLALLREDRTAASAVSKTSSKKKAPVVVADLFKEIEDL